jgi:small GTP-binding protein
MMREHSNGSHRRTAASATKIVVTGPFAAGKTTLIRTISEITVLSTEQGISDETATRKQGTTVAMDFGRISIDRDLVLYLFGTPGQDRFEFMWDILGEGMLGYLLVIDATDPDSLAQARPILTAFSRMASVPHVVALNRADQPGAIDAARVRAELPLAPDAPVVACDATDKESVKNVLLALLYAVVESLGEPMPGQVPARSSPPQSGSTPGSGPAELAAASRGGSPADTRG